MAKNIEPTLKLISGYLKQEKTANFVIPEYQRGYSWDITQCDKLWQDIESFIESSASDPYFFGTIILDCSETNKFNIIDGQQRTTTFLLLLKALLIRINEVISKILDDEDSEALKAGLKAKRNKIMAILYKAEDEEIPAMLKDESKIKNILVIENKSINESHIEEVKKIIEAIDFEEAEQIVHKISRKQKDNKYTNHFRNFKYFYFKLIEKSDSQLNQFANIFLEKCQIIEIRSWEVEQAITMFNSLNSSGMPLSDADIISAQLYSNANKDTGVFTEQWKAINILTNELNIRKIATIDSILQQFMYLNRAIHKEYININNEGKEIVNLTTPGLRKYYKDEDEIGVKNPRKLLNNPEELCLKLNKICSIWDKIKDYTIVKLLLKFNENSKLFLVGYLFRFDISNIKEENVSEISQSLLRLFTILELVDAGYSSKNFKTFLFAINIKLVDTSFSIGEIQKEFNDHINNVWNEEDLSKSILEYENNILVFLNDYLYAKRKDVQFSFNESVNIEHIMPASGRNIESIRQDAGIEDKEEFNHIVNKLGNKILLEEDINKSISNDWFKTKKQNSINSRSGYKDSKYSIALNLTNYSKEIWTKDDIEIATKKASNRIVKFIFNKN